MLACVCELNTTTKKNKFRVSLFYFVRRPAESPTEDMDSNPHKLTNPTNWELRMAMEDQILHNQLPFDSSLWPDYLLQTHQISCSSSTQLPSSAHHFADHQQMAQNHNHQDHQIDEEGDDQEAEEELGPVKEMMYKIAAMQPVDIDPATIRKPKRRNVRISNDPQSVAARHRREKISEKIRILQRLVPGGTKLDTASMLDEAVRYVKFLKRQIRQLQLNHNPPCPVLHHIPPPEWPFATSKPLGSGNEPRGGPDMPSGAPEQAAILEALGRS